MGCANILCYIYGIRLPMAVVDVGIADMLRSSRSSSSSFSTVFLGYLSLSPNVQYGPMS